MFVDWIGIDGGFPCCGMRIVRRDCPGIVLIKLVVIWVLDIRGVWAYG
jgi:hypothetical protein